MRVVFLQRLSAAPMRLEPHHTPGPTKETPCSIRTAWVIVVTLLLLLALAPLAKADDTKICAQAAIRAETAHGLPRGLLQAISLTETGRWDSARGAGSAWPWTLNTGGEGRHYASRGAVASALHRLIAAGDHRVDVGCFQINLHHHPDAFGSISAALDPDAGAVYAARFLRDLKAEFGSWRRAVAAYHSRHHARGEAYAAKVIAALRGLRAAPQPPQSGALVVASQHLPRQAQERQAAAYAASWREERLAQWQARQGS